MCFCFSKIIVRRIGYGKLLKKDRKMRENLNSKFFIYLETCNRINFNEKISKICLHCDS